MTENSLKKGISMKNLILTEIQTNLIALRTSPKARSKRYEADFGSDGKLENMLKKLKEILYFASEDYTVTDPSSSSSSSHPMSKNASGEAIFFIKKISFLDILAPFFEIVKAEDTNGPVTTVAIQSIQKLLENPEINRFTQNIEIIMKEIIHNLKLSQFEGTDTSNDEACLVKILEIFGTIVTCDAGFSLDETSILDIIKFCFQVIRTSRPTDFVIRSGTTVLHSIVETVYKRILSGETLDYVSLKQKSAKHGYSPPKSQESNENTKTNEITSILEMETIFEFICNLCDPEIEGKSTTVRLLGLSLANLVLEILGRDLPSFPKLLFLTQNLLSRALLQNSVTNNIVVMSETLKGMHHLIFCARDFLHEQIQSFLISTHLRALYGGFGATFISSMLNFSAASSSANSSNSATPMTPIPSNQNTNIFNEFQKTLQVPQIHKPVMPSLVHGPLINQQTSLELQELVLENLNDLICGLDSNSNVSKAEEIEISFVPFLFKSYDCSENSSNLLESFIQFFCAVIHESWGLSDSESPQNHHTTNGSAQQQQQQSMLQQQMQTSNLHLLCLNGLLGLLRGIAERIRLRQQYAIENEQKTQILEQKDSETGSKNEKDVILQREFQQLQAICDKKEKFLCLIGHFNVAPKKGIAMLRQYARVLTQKSNSEELLLQEPISPQEPLQQKQNSPQEPSQNPPSNEEIEQEAKLIASMLHDYNEWISKESLGECLIKFRGLFYDRLLFHYLSKFRFGATTIDEALRLMIHHIPLRGEGQEVTRILEYFGKAFFLQNSAQNSQNLPENSQAEEQTNIQRNPSKIKVNSADDAYVLAVAVVMLNTDLHNEQNQSKMALDQFKALVASSMPSGNTSIDPNELEIIYQNVRNQEFEMQNSFYSGYKSDLVWKELLLKSISKRKQQNSDNLTPAVLDLAIFTKFWRQIVLAISTIIENSNLIENNESILNKCMQGFLDCGVISSHYCLSSVLDNIIIRLCHFTKVLSVTSPSSSVVITTNQNPDFAAQNTENASFKEQAEDAIIRFGQSMLAQTSAKTVFAIIRLGGGNQIREAWKNIIDLILRMYELDVLTDEMLGREPFLENSFSKISTRKPQKRTNSEELQQQQATKVVKPAFGMLFSAFGGFFGGGSSNYNDGYKLELLKNAEKITEVVVKQCRIAEMLNNDVKFLLDDISLIHILKVLIICSLERNDKLFVFKQQQQMQQQQQIDMMQQHQEKQQQQQLQQLNPEILSSSPSENIINLSNLSETLSNSVKSEQKKVEIIDPLVEIAISSTLEHERFKNFASNSPVCSPSSNLTGKRFSFSSNSEISLEDEKENLKKFSKNSQLILNFLFSASRSKERRGVHTCMFCVYLISEIIIANPFRISEIWGVILKYFDIQLDDIQKNFEKDQGLKQSKFIILDNLLKGIMRIVLFSFEKIANRVYKSYYEKNQNQNQTETQVSNETQTENPKIINSNSKKKFDLSEKEEILMQNLNNLFLLIEKKLSVPVLNHVLPQIGFAMFLWCRNKQISDLISSKEVWDSICRLLKQCGKHPEAFYHSFMAMKWILKNEAFFYPENIPQITETLVFLQNLQKKPDFAFEYSTIENPDKVKFFEEVRQTNVLFKNFLSDVFKIFGQ